MICLHWKWLLRGALPFAYLLLSACGGGGEGGDGSGAAGNRLIHPTQAVPPWQIPSKRIIPDGPFQPDLSWIFRKDVDAVLEPDDIVVPQIEVLADIDPQEATRQLSTFKAQNISWGACDDVVAKQDLSRFFQAQRDLRGWATTIQCAVVDAPMNYHAPERDGVAGLRLLRIAIGDPSGKRHLLFNPGGPGQPGLLSPMRLAAAFLTLSRGGLDENGDKHADQGGSNETPDPKMVELAQKMIDKYVFVGFSPRGSYEMLPVEVARGRQHMWSWNTYREREEIRLEKNARAFGASFAQNKNARFVHSDAVVRDMDLIRHLLNEEKLHYHGVSYGTTFGLWHAGLFPDTTGRMLLEAVVDFASDPEPQYLEEAGPWLRNFLTQMPFAYSVMDSFKFFPKDRQDIDITQILGSLDSSLQFLVMDQLHTAAEQAAANRKLYDYLVAVLLAAKYFQEGASMDQKFSEYEEIDSLIKAIMTRYALLKGDRPQTFSNTAPRSFGREAFWCNDAQHAHSAESLRDVLRRAAGKFYLADIEGLDSPCAFWPFKRKNAVKPTLEAIHRSGVDKNILLLNAEWDRATTMSGAKRMREALPDARFIQLMESTRHNFFPTTSSLIDGAVYRHFVDDVLPDSDIKATASVFDDLIGKGGEMLRNPETDPLPYGVFNTALAPTFD